MTARGRLRPSGYEAQSGTSRSDANFAYEASPVNTPRAGADVTSQKPKIRIAGRIASFEFELDTYCVNG